MEDGRVTREGLSKFDSSPFELQNIQTCCITSQCQCRKPLSKMMKGTGMRQRKMTHLGEQAGTDRNRPEDVT